MIDLLWNIAPNDDGSLTIRFPSGDEFLTMNVEEDLDDARYYIQGRVTKPVDVLVTHSDGYQTIESW